MFWKKDDTREKVINSDEYERLLKKFLDTDSGIKSLKIDVDIIRTDMENLRRKFNQVIRGVTITQEEEKPKDLSSSNELPFG